jgi:hypothetical protein
LVTRLRETEKPGNALARSRPLFMDSKERSYLQLRGKYATRYVKAIETREIPADMTLRAYMRSKGENV